VVPHCPTPKLPSRWINLLKKTVGMVKDGQLPVSRSAWYSKEQGTFSDVIVFVRRQLWAARYCVDSLSHPSPQNYTIPASTPAGSYHLLACADDLGAVSESNETNNCIASAGMVQVAGGLPDLIETAVSSSLSAAFPGETLEVTDTMVN
jgi:hypothetical protein